MRRGSAGLSAWPSGSPSRWSCSRSFKTRCAAGAASWPGQFICCAHTFFRSGGPPHPAGSGDAGVRRGNAGARRSDGVRFRRAGAAALGAERDPVPGGAGRNVAQANSVDLPRRRAVRADRRRRRPGLRLRLGCECRRAVHRAGNLVDRTGLGIAELRRTDHLRTACAVRAAIPARRLDRYPVGAWPSGGSQLARNAYRYR